MDSAQSLCQGRAARIAVRPVDCPAAVPSLFALMEVRGPASTSTRVSPPPNLGARIASEAKNHRAPLTGGARTLRACSRVPLAPHTAALSQITHGAHDGTSLHAITTPPSGAGAVPPRPRSITLSYVGAQSGNERRRVGAAAAESRGAHCTGGNRVARIRDVLHLPETTKRDFAEGSRAPLYVTVT